MRIRNFYRSRSDLDKMQGVRQFLVPIVTKLYNGEVEGAQRIKESSLPLLTLFNSMETILSELCGREYPELGVAELWDSLRYRSRNPRTEHRLLRFLDFNYYDRDAAPPFRDFQAPTEIIRYRYGSEYIVTGQASVRWPSGTTIYQLTMNDLQVRNGAANVDMSDYYFGVVIAMVKSGDTDLTPENRVYGIITAAEKWNETVQPSGAAPQDIRYTQLFPNSFFTGISSGSTLRMYPILSKNRYNGTEAMDYSTVIAGQDNPVYPLPFDPIDCIYHFQEALIQLAVTITRTGTGYLRLNMTARNLTDTQQVVNLDLVTFWFIVYPKDSNHSTQYDQATYYPSDAQTGGAYTWSSDGGETGEIEVPASGTVTLAMNGINYTDSSYGCYITLSMDYPYGVVAGGGATLDYDL